MNLYWRLLLLLHWWLSLLNLIDSLDIWDKIWIRRGWWGTWWWLNWFMLFINLFSLNNFGLFVTWTLSNFKIHNVLNLFILYFLLSCINMSLLDCRSFWWTNVRWQYIWTLHGWRTLEPKISTSEFIFIIANTWWTCYRWTCWIQLVKFFLRLPVNEIRVW